MSSSFSDAFNRGLTRMSQWGTYRPKKRRQRSSMSAADSDHSSISSIGSQVSDEATNPVISTLHALSDLIKVCNDNIKTQKYPLAIATIQGFQEKVNAAQLKLGDMSSHTAPDGEHQLVLLYDDVKIFKIELGYSGIRLISGQTPSEPESLLVSKMEALETKFDTWVENYIVPWPSSLSYPAETSTSTVGIGPSYAFAPTPGILQPKHSRLRYRYEEIERMYKCGWNGCEKAYGTLNHLNAHISMQAHGRKRTPEEFKEIRKEWKARKKAEEEESKRRDKAVIGGSKGDGLATGEGLASALTLND